MYIIVIVIVAAYLFGSIPTAVWLGRAFKGIDLREHGSGNAGATNAFRVLGKTIGSVVLLLDMLKGYAAVSLAHVQSLWILDSEEGMILKIVLGLVAVAGHIFPVFAGFRGGKGVATMAGVGLALHPLAVLAAIGIYVLVFLLLKISALGSLSAVTTYPLWVIWVFPTPWLSMKLFSLLVFILVLITHRSNIRRLLKGEEKALRPPS